MKSLQLLLIVIIAVSSTTLINTAILKAQTQQNKTDSHPIKRSGEGHVSSTDALPAIDE